MRSRGSFSSFFEFPQLSLLDMNGQVIRPERISHPDSHNLNANVHDTKQLEISSLDSASAQFLGKQSSHAVANWLNTRASNLFKMCVFTKHFSLPTVIFRAQPMHILDTNCQIPASVYSQFIHRDGSKTTESTLTKSDGAGSPSPLTDSE